MAVLRLAGSEPVNSTPDSRFHHLVTFVDSDDDLWGLMAESAMEGLDRREAVVLAVDEIGKQRISDLLGPATASVSFGDGTARYTSPARAMKGLVDLVTQQLEAGHSRVRSIGQVRPDWVRPHRWIHYEACVNEVMAGLPVTGVCFYDTRFISEDTRRGMEGTHLGIGPTIAASTPAGYRHPRGLIEDLPVISLCPERDPDLVLSEISSLRAVRTAVTELAPPGRGDDVSLVVHELTSLGLLEGGSPLVRLWHEPRRLVVRVQEPDTGSFADPCAGLRPPEKGGEVALWVAAQLADDLAVDGSGATVAFDRRR